MSIDDARDAFLVELAREIKACGSPSAAYDKFEAGRDLIFRCEVHRVERKVRPQAATLQMFIEKGGPRLRRTAQEFLEALSGTSLVGRIEHKGEFSFLRASMQFLMGDYDALLRGCLDREPSIDLEELAAIGLVRSNIAGQYCRCIADCVGSNRRPIPPREMGENEERECIKTARELLDLAKCDELQLYRRLRSYVGTMTEVLGEQEKQSIRTADAGRLLGNMVGYVQTAYRVAETFVDDGGKSADLRARPLYRLAFEIYKMLDIQDLNFRLATQGALRSLGEKDPVVAQSAIERMENIELCLTGHRRLHWMGERAVATFSNEGVRVQRSLARTEPDKVVKIRAGASENTSTDEMECWIFDPSVSEETLQEIEGKPVLCSDHWINLWRPGDPERRVPPKWARKTRKSG